MEQLIFLCKAVRQEIGGTSAEIEALIREYHPESSTPASRYLLLGEGSRERLAVVVDEKLASGWRLHGRPIVESDYYYQGVCRDL